MQDRYAGDIGDYIKLGLLRALAGDDRSLGIAWYLYPDEHHNSDGKHVAYLSDEEHWKDLDERLFNELARVVKTGRSVQRLEVSGMLNGTYFRAPVPDQTCAPDRRSEARQRWFGQALRALSHCDLVFADPDNGLIDDRPDRRRGKTFGKQLPLSEAKALAKGRAAIIYHHNTRFPGGHDREVDYWLSQLGNAIAIRANAFSCRTFFVMNPDRDLIDRANKFCARWADRRVWLLRPSPENFAQAARPIALRVEEALSA